tara:strand:- start:302 stop:793 length:492 start_codon:yes stop_codon:yes gene_type:complete
MTTPFLRAGWGFVRGVRVSPIQRQFIISAFNRGLTTTATQAALRTGGLGLRRAAIVEVMGSLRGGIETGKRLQSLRRDFKLTEALFQTATVRQKAEYRFFTQVHARSLVTGEIDKFEVNFGSDHNLTRNEINDRAEEIAEVILEKYEYELDHIEITGATRLGI